MSCEFWDPPIENRFLCPGHKVVPRAHCAPHFARAIQYLLALASASDAPHITHSYLLSGSLIAAGFTFGAACPT